MARKIDARTQEQLPKNKVIKAELSHWVAGMQLGTHQEKIRLVFGLGVCLFVFRFIFHLFVCDLTEFM